MLGPLVPREMIAAEQKSVPIQENRMAARMSGRRDHPQIRRDLDDVIAGRLQFDHRRGVVHVAPMEDAAASEALHEPGVIGNVVLMSQEHRRDATEAVDVPRQWLIETR